MTKQTVQIKEDREKALYAGGRSFYLFILIVHFFWAISGPLTKMSYDGFGLSGSDVLEVICFAGIRLFGGGVIALTYCCLQGIRLMPAHIHDFCPIVKLSLIMGVAQYVLFNFGAAFSSGVQTSILSSAGAFCGILISAFIFKDDALTARKLIGCILGVIAVAVLNWQDLRLGVSTSLFGALLLLLGQATGVFGAAYLKLISNGRSAIWVGGWQSVISGILLLPLGLLGHVSFPFEQAHTALLPSTALIITSGVALIFSNQLYKYNPLSKVMIFSLLSPVLGVLSSAILLGDSLQSASVLCSLAINCLGVALVTTEKQPVHKS